MAIALESIAVSEFGEVVLPSSIASGDLLLALVYWGNNPAIPLDGFTTITTGGSSFDWLVAQYRIADGSETSPITPDPSWASNNAIVARITGHAPADPINVGGAGERIAGSSATSKTVELDSISPDAAGTALVTLAFSSHSGTLDSVTVGGVAADLLDEVDSLTGAARLETLSGSGATGVRSVVASRAAGGVQNIVGAMIALNPAGAEPEPEPSTIVRMWPGLLLPV